MKSLLFDFSVLLLTACEKPNTALMHFASSSIDQTISALAPNNFKPALLGVALDGRARAITLGGFWAHVYCALSINAIEYSHPLNFKQGTFWSFWRKLDGPLK